jgi:hypothetical protein
MDEYTILKNFVPQDIQEGIRSCKMNKVAEKLFGIDGEDLYKIAQLMGARMYYRRSDRRKMAEYVEAMKNL